MNALMLHYAQEFFCQMETHGLQLQEVSDYLNIFCRFSFVVLQISYESRFDYMN